MGAEVEEIIDRTHRQGILGYLRSGNEAWFGRRAPIERPSMDPAAFDLVLIGTPVWRVSLASPVRTYLHDYAPRIRQAGFFCTMGGFGSARVFRQMQQLCGRAPLATFARTERQLGGADLAAAVEQFASRLGAPAMVRP